MTTKQKIAAGAIVIGAGLLIAGYLTAEQWLGVVAGALGAA